MKKREPLVEAYEEPDQPPERSLIAAILARAFCDLLNNLSNNDVEYRRANGWLRSNSKKPFSFIWCCLALDLSALHVRNRVLEMEKAGVKLELEKRRVEDDH